MTTATRKHADLIASSEALIAKADRATGRRVMHRDWLGRLFDLMTFGWVAVLFGD